MRWSEDFIPTLKESPQDAEVLSHKLMVRAGIIQKLSSGLYTFLPLGLKVLENIKRIIREEMSKKGAIELLMPILQPKEIWLKSGRYEIMSDLMLRVKDREDREFVLGPTHEEIITDLVAHRIDSYRMLPKNFYQIQSKFRDEIRPRFGVIRAREFVMKDGYSFSLTKEDSEKIYQDMYDAYNAIFRRCGLNCAIIEADTGVMGGKRSHEFTAIADAGEDVVVRCPSCSYAANRELATRQVKPASGKTFEPLPLEEVSTPGLKKVEELAGFFKCSHARFIKTLIYRGKSGLLAVLIRGDLEVNEVKLRHHLLGEEIQLAEPEEIKKLTGADMGFSGPVGLKGVRRIADTSVKGMTNAVTGANRNDTHYKNVNLERDFQADEWADIGFPVEGDLCPRCAKGLSFSRGIEVGQVFELGTKYSARLSAVIQNDKGEDVPLVMGCYGIGVSRTVAAVIEQNHDDKGIIWPLELAPYKVIIIPLLADEKIKEISERIYSALREKGVEVLFDDRDERAGFKFADADLIGIPCKVIIGNKALKENKIEIKSRKTGKVVDVAPERAVEEILKLIEKM
jgi:prolyl-tRNA synthetase